MSGTRSPVIFEIWVLPPKMQMQKITARMPPMIMGVVPSWKKL